MHAATHSLMPTLAGLQQFQARGLAHARTVDALSVDSMELLRGQKAVEIKHNGSVYRLQTTKLGKLILTK